MPRSNLFRKLMLAMQQARRANLVADGLPPPLCRGDREWSRRRFTKAAAVSGLALVPGLSPLSRQVLAAERLPEIAVIGGGLAGLNAAYRLQRAGYPATVYEAAARLGGRIHSRVGAVGDGLVTELGGELINSDHADILSLAAEFGLNLFNRRAGQGGREFAEVAYYFRGQAYPESRIAEDLRPLAAKIASDAALLDEDWDTHAPRFDRRSVRAYLDRHRKKIPQAYVRDLIESAIRAEYGVEPQESTALQLLDMLPTVNGQAAEILGYSDELYRIQGGNGKIIDELAAALTGRIQSGMFLTGIKARGQGFRLDFRGGITRNVDLVIVAIPFPVLRALRLEVRLPQGLRSFIDELSLGRNEKLIAGFSHRFWRQPAGFSLEAWTDLGFCETWDETPAQADQGDSALVFYLGGREVRRTRSGSTEYHGQRFIERLESFVPGAMAAATGRYERSRWSENRLCRGSYSNFRPGQLTRFGGLMWVESENPAERQEVAEGNLIFAGEHLSDAYYGFMNGAAETGRLAAEVAVRKLAGLAL